MQLETDSLTRRPDKALLHGRGRATALATWTFRYPSWPPRLLTSLVIDDTQNGTLGTLGTLSHTKDGGSVIVHEPRRTKHVSIVSCLFLLLARPRACWQTSNSVIPTSACLTEGTGPEPSMCALLPRGRGCGKQFWLLDPGFPAAICVQHLPLAGSSQLNDVRWSCRT